VESELEKIPVQGKVNTPASGTYGEGAALDGLKKALPSTGNAPAGPAPGAPIPLSPEPPLAPVPPPNQSSPQQPTGVPNVLLSPTGRPMEPGTAMPMEPASFPQVERSAAEQRLQVLMSLANDPRVSEETREWAELWIRTLTGARV